MTIVIPVKEDTKHNYTELRYAIRSLEKNLNGFGDIFIIGKIIKPLKGLKYIHCPDVQGSKFKERNIFNKIMKTCNHPDISEDFIFLNDDHFLTKPFDINNLPFYHKGELSGTMAKNNGDYRKSVNHTKKFLEERSLSTLDFDTHFPIVYNKTKFSRIFTDKSIDFDRPFGYVIKSLYANSLKIEGEYGGDCKVQAKLSYEEIKAKVGDKSFFSTSDGSINEGMIKYLNELYPNKSSYER